MPESWDGRFPSDMVISFKMGSRVTSNKANAAAGRQEPLGCTACLSHSLSVQSPETQPLGFTALLSSSRIAIPKTRHLQTIPMAVMATAMAMQSPTRMLTALALLETVCSRA